MGRAKREIERRRESRNNPGDKFARMFLRTMQTPAWRALTPYARLLYPWLVLELKKGATNNGCVRLSVKQASERIPCNVETARKAFLDLQAKGFIVVTRCAELGVEGEARAHEYELTEFGRAWDSNPRRLYQHWKPGNDCSIVRAPAHNPTGKGGWKNRTQTDDVSPAPTYETASPDLPDEMDGAETSRFPTYRVSHPYLPGGVGEADDLCGACRPSPLCLPRRLSGRVNHSDPKSSNSRVFTTAARRYAGKA